MFTSFPPCRGDGSRTATTRCGSRTGTWFLTRPPTGGGGVYLVAVVAPHFVWSQVLDATLGHRFGLPGHPTGTYVNPIS